MKILTAQICSSFTSDVDPKMISTTTVALEKISLKVYYLKVEQDTLCLLFSLAKFHSKSLRYAILHFWCVLKFSMHSKASNAFYVCIQVQRYFSVISMVIVDIR